MKNILHNIIMIIICLGLLFVLQITFVFFLFAMLPAVVAFFIDDSKRKYIYKTVLACNLAGMLPPLTEFSRSKLQAANFEMALYDPRAWFIAYGSAAGGWVLIWTCRFIAHQIVEVTCDGKIADLEKEKMKLIEEWGETVKSKKRKKAEAAV